MQHGSRSMPTAQGKGCPHCPERFVLCHYKLTERLTYDQVREKLEAGEHERADIPIPEAPAPEPAETALVPMSLVQALYQEMGRLQDRLLESERERGRLEGRLSELESREAPWWRRLLRE